LKILWVKAGKLLPVDSGGKIRSFNLLRCLQRQHEVTLLSYYFGRQDLAYEAEITGMFHNTIPFASYSPLEELFGGTLHYLLRLPLSAPYSVSKFTVGKVKLMLADWLNGKKFDVAVCDFLSASLNFSTKLHTPTVLFQHNVENVLWGRQAQHEPNWFKRKAFRLEATKMLRYETAAVRRFHHIIAVSDEDRAQFAKMTTPSRISVCPTGVDLQRYRFAASPVSSRQHVVFLGSMDWEANIDGVEFFHRDIWPRVLAQVPDAIFQIVGRNPHSRVRRLAGPSVEVTGTVSSVTEYLCQATTFVVPLRIGGGSRLKIYEAMATGKAIVSTSVGAEGLDIHPGEDILLADDAEQFSACVVRTLKDVDLRHRLAVAAAQNAAQYDWSVIASRFAQVLDHTVRTASASGTQPTVLAQARV
jgi:glycosyltransferase involved in cell wall biosynthesis